MKITTIDEARQLIGKTLCRDGEERTVKRFCFSKEWNGIIWQMGQEKRERFGLKIPVLKASKYEDFIEWMDKAWIKIPD